MLYRIKYSDELCHAKKGEAVPGSKYISRKWNGKSWSYIYTTAKRETKAAIDKYTKDLRDKKAQKENEKKNGGKSYFDGKYYDYEGAKNELIDIAIRNSSTPDYVKKYLDDKFNKYLKEMDSASAIYCLGVDVATRATVHDADEERAYNIAVEGAKMLRNKISLGAHYGDKVYSNAYNGQPPR